MRDNSAEIREDPARYLQIVSADCPKKSADRLIKAFVRSAADSFLFFSSSPKHSFLIDRFVVPMIDRMI